MCRHSGKRYGTPQCQPPQSASLALCHRQRRLFSNTQLGKPGDRRTKMPRSNCDVMSKEPSTNLESAMQMLIKTFHKYSGKEGDKFTLSRGELRELLTEELGNYLGNAQDKDAVERVMSDLDANNDGEVDFTEFIILMGALTVACNDFFLDSPPPKNKPESKSDAKDGENKE
ncbi:S100 calcium binding protein S isoform X1 [Ictalurus punctatus]|nr:S100 calcium binding protein S isoform X1 [Ictalurus punctatus]